MRNQAENSTMIAAFIGLGSNLNGPVDQVTMALTELAGLPETASHSHSSLYQSRPMGGLDQPDYVNAVARVDTRLEPEELLEQLHAIETAHGRVREERWGARTLDLDLLLYGSITIDTPDLQVPHPGVGERGFVLYPLYEIAPDLEIPGLGAVSDLVNNCPTEKPKII
jgi:2-amino-4-hydroxy-6-hydroxymethyldihydropteridine diphosphokinase